MDDDAPHDPSRCWWRGCVKRGTLGELAGRRVLLCPTHTGAVTIALRDAERFEVRWGEWTRDILARKRRQVLQTRAVHAALPDADEKDWPSEKDRLGWAIDELEGAIDEMSAGPDRPPIISVRNLMDTPPPVPEGGFRDRPPRP